MSVQIAMRIPERQLEALDQAVENGEFKSRADGIRQALNELMTARKEVEIARQYEAAYASAPADPALGEAGAELASEAIAAEENQR